MTAKKSWWERRNEYSRTFISILILMFFIITFGSATLSWLDSLSEKEKNYWLGIEQQLSEDWSCREWENETKIEYIEKGIFQETVCEPDLSNPRSDGTFSQKCRIEKYKDQICGPYPFGCHFDKPIEIFYEQRNETVSVCVREGLDCMEKYHVLKGVGGVNGEWIEVEKETYDIFVEDFPDKVKKSLVCSQERLV